MPTRDQNAIAALKSGRYEAADIIMMTSNEEWNRFQQEWFRDHFPKYPPAVRERYLKQLQETAAIDVEAFGSHHDDQAKSDRAEIFVYAFELEAKAKAAGVI